MKPIDILAYGACISAIAGFLPQIIQTFKTHKTCECSIFPPVLLLTSCVLNLIYSLMTEILPLTVFFGILCIIVFMQLYSNLKFKTGDTQEPHTNIYNRQSFFEQAEKELIRSQRYYHPFTMLIFDIDDYDNFILRMGSDTTKQMLGLLANELKCKARQSDIMGQLGEKTLVLLLPESNLNDAQTVAERVIKRCHQAKIETPEGETNFTISIGISCKNDNDKSVDEILERAHKALERARENGNDQLQVMIGE